MPHVTFFKDPKPSAKVQRALRRIERDAAEDREKAKVRQRDRGCRFPLCGCRRLRLTLEVSHNEHKGAGGNPDGSRSTTELMMQLCRERHRTNPFSIHNRAIEWQPLEKKLGANGPVKWLIDRRLLRYYLHGGQRPAEMKLVEVVRETAVGILGPMDDADRALLEQLARMEF